MNKKGPSYCKGGAAAEYDAGDDEHDADADADADEYDADADKDSFVFANSEQITIRLSSSMPPRDENSNDDGPPPTFGFLREAVATKRRRIPEYDSRCTPTVEGGGKKESSSVLCLLLLK